MLSAPAYTGVDVSPTALARCRERFPGHRFVPFDAVGGEPAADLALSVDVIFHLVENTVFASYLDAVFAHARRFVLIYASNVDMTWPATHVRHRRFSDRVASACPGWRLLRHVPNPYPFDPARPDDTSFADFFAYGRVGAAEATIPA
jgi:hypothetical protein